MAKARLIYKVSFKQISNDRKVDKAIKARKTLLTRVKKEGETKWLKNALVKNAEKLKKYSIKPETISA